MGMVTVGIDCSSTLSLSLEACACALLASETVCLVCIGARAIVRFDSHGKE